MGIVCCKEIGNVFLGQKFIAPGLVDLYIFCFK